MAFHEARAESFLGDCISLQPENEVVKIPQVQEARRKYAEAGCRRDNERDIGRTGIALSRGQYVRALVFPADIVSML